MALPDLDIDRLSAEERIQLADELWESLRQAPEQVPLTPAQAAELDRRAAAYRRDGDAGQPWREALDELGRRGG